MSQITVRRANTILTVPDYQKEEYIAKGFDVIDSQTGKVIEHSLPADVNVLKRAYVEHIALLKQKDEEIARLRKEVNSLKEVEAKKASTPSKDIQADESVDKPKATRTRKPKA